MSSADSSARIYWENRDRDLISAAAQKIDERADGVHLSYDSMASLIAPYGSQAALVVARDLDAKIECLLVAAAR